MRTAVKPSLAFSALVVAIGLVLPGAAQAAIEQSNGGEEPNHAAAIDDGYIAVDDTELSQQRGGFAIGGMDIRLGAEMRTYLNGDLVLSTVVNWDTAGATTTQMVSNTLTPAYQSALQSGFVTGQGVSLKLGDSPVFLANNGQTAIIQNTSGAIQNVVLNAADNINLVQQTDISLDLTGYAGFKTDLVSNRIADSLNGVMGAVTLGAVTH
jgi:hypothetical protein